MTTPMKPIKYLVDKMLGQGLYILAGAPKVGKSWLALDLCLSVAKGVPFLKRNTEQGYVAYLSLEDSLIRLQNRLYELTDEPSDNLSFAIMAGAIGNGLESQIEDCKQSNPTLKLVVIDTLQKVRQSSESSYGSDYKELSSLKALADKLKITILLVHHTRKCSDKDPFNTISGTTGISGSADGSFVLVESKRGSREAKLHCVGRDIENLEINVVFQNSRWNVVDDAPQSKPDFFSFGVHDYMITQKFFRGTATQLCEQLKGILGSELFPNRVTRDLLQHSFELERYGVFAKPMRSNGQRLIILEYNAESDSSDGKKLMPDTSEITVPTVTEKLTNADTEPLLSKEITDSSDNATDPAPQTTVPADGSAFLQKVSDRMRNQLAPPFRPAKGV